MQTSQEAIHVKRAASVLLHSPKIYIPNASRESHMASVVPLNSSVSMKQKGNQDFPLGAAHQRFQMERKEECGFLKDFTRGFWEIHSPIWF